MNKISYSLGLAIIGIALLVGAAYAADSATMSVSATNTESIEVTVNPASINEWSLVVGGNTYEVSATTATIRSNVETGNNAALSVKETASGDNIADGKMYCTSPTHTMTSGLVLDATTTDALDISPLTGEDQLMYTLAAAGEQVVDFDFKQTVGTEDPAGTYTIDVQFTGAIVAE